MAQLRAELQQNPRSADEWFDDSHIEDSYLINLAQQLQRMRQ
jgi:hypothetical protein